MSNNHKEYCAGFLSIGNEILSGRILENNANFAAKILSEIGIEIYEIRIIRDDIDIIVESLKQLKQNCKYIFTSGGLGPTHDDITTAAITKYLGDSLVINQQAMDILAEFYTKNNREINEARIKMAKMPSSVKDLILNPLGSACGYKTPDDVYVLPGVPSMFKAMMQNIAIDLESKIDKSSTKIYNKTIRLNAFEGDIADPLEAIQNKYPEVTIGSYPNISINGSTSFKVSDIVFYSRDKSAFDKVEAEVQTLSKRFP